MKKDKEIKLYEEPVIKVVKFTIEHGFSGSFGGGSEGIGDGSGIPIDGDDDEIPLGSNRSFSVDHSFQRSFDGSF
jgi:hypothetical protein